MGKQKTAAYYSQKAAEAKAREAFRAKRPPRPRAGGTVTPKNTETYIYRSLFKKWIETAGDTTSSDHFPFIVDVDKDALAKVPAASVGILAEADYKGNKSLAESVKRRLHPSRASWYAGVATPTVVTTGYGTSWIKYYEPAAGAAQSHFSLPISKALGAFTAADVHETFGTVFKGTNKSTLLGANNGSAELRLEYSNSSNRTST